jgi:hypothetical protein
MPIGHVAGRYFNLYLPCFSRTQLEEFTRSGIQQLDAVKCTAVKWYSVCHPPVSHDIKVSVLFIADLSCNNEAVSFSFNSGNYLKNVAVYYVNKCRDS